MNLYKIDYVHYKPEDFQMQRKPKAAMMTLYAESDTMAIDRFYANHARYNPTFPYFGGYQIQKVLCLS